MALDNVTSHFSTMLEPITSASFLSSLSIIHACSLLLKLERNTGKIMDSHFRYFRVFKEYPQKSQIWKSETRPNQGTWLGIPWLGLVSLCQIWDFYGYSLNTLKYPKMGIRYFFLWKLFEITRDKLELFT